MKNSKEMLDKENIVPFLKLVAQLESGGTKSIGPHRVRLMKDEIVEGKNFQGNVEEKMRYWVEEDGMEKKYDAPLRNEQGELHYLVQRLAEFEENDEIVLEYMRKGPRGYINVSLPDETQEVDKEDIPVITEETPVGEPPEDLPKEEDETK